MSAAVAGWLFDTLLITGVLIALVLLVRRPISRHFGPQIAYALWALPLLRFVMPPIVLPASMAPVAKAPIWLGESAFVQPDLVSTELAKAVDPVVDEVVSASLAVPADALINWMDIAVPLWLAGAAVFLFVRLRNYRAMRARLLAQASPVGEAGRVRLVETPAVSSPVAFGVRDKVVALPPCFMAQHDRVARDMAIAHELAHHRGHDLLANIAAQPLLAFHWFNPLAWWGWRAMRRDQEAACDARVIAGKGKRERAAYAQVIVGFAAGDDLALAAPMACPVLGEKSIIHRLRSLTMSDISSGRRNLGIAAITTTALALPLTGSISYAHPQLSPAPRDAPTVPALPAAPAAPHAPLPPLAPDAPQPLQAPAAPQPRSIESVDPDLQAALIERSMAREHRALALQGARESQAEAQGAALAAMTRARAARANAMAHAQQARQQAATSAESVVMAHRNLDCGPGANTLAGHSAQASEALVTCRQAAQQALSGIRAARSALSNLDSLPEGIRSEVLESLDEEIERLETLREVAIGPVAIGPVTGRMAVHFATGSTTGHRALQVRHVAVKRVVYVSNAAKAPEVPAPFMLHGLTT